MGYCLYGWNGSWFTSYGYLNSNVIAQVKATIIPIANADLPLFSLLGESHFNNIIILVGTITGLLYFYFSKEHTGIFGKVSKVGIYFLMIKFGASFGFAVMGRISLLIGRFEELIKFSAFELINENDALKIYSPTLVILFFMIVTLIYWTYKQNNEETVK